MKTKTPYCPLIYCILLLMLLSCARKMNPDIERGTGYEYKSGHPEVRLTAMGTLDDQYNTKLEIIADIVYGSLMFKGNNKRVADLSIELLVFDLDNNEDIVYSKRFSYDQEVEDYQLTTSQDIFTLKRQIDVNPGNYRVMLTLIDQTMDKQSTRVVNTSVPDPKTENSALTTIRMMGKEVEKQQGNNWDPITTYDVPGKLDSLMFNYQILNRSDQNLTLNSKLIKFRTDTSYAKPMNRAFGSMASLFDEGINYKDREVIQSNRRVLTQKGNISIEYKFLNLSRGNYRFIVDAQGEDQEFFKARDFSIKSSNYPTLKSAEELARPLIYLMNPNEYRDLMAIEDRDSLKSEVDRFWLRKLGNKSRARAVIELYYERVEEANKHFSNFKEGWKTDRGMIYILFGPPWYREKYNQEISWSYTYDLSDPDLNFDFQQVKVQSEYFPFEHYVLQRESSYYTVLNRQKQLWLSGRILERKL